MPTETTDRRDRHGFPIVACYRCGGSGRYSFNLRDLDRCYGCQGTGWNHAVPKHHAAWLEAVRTAVRVNAQDLRPGDVVKRWGASDPLSGRRYTDAERPARTVVAVTVTDEACHWTIDECTAIGWVTEITWDDGTTESTGGTSMFARQGVSVDPAPYVAKAERGLAYLRSPEGQARMAARRREREAREAAGAREEFARRD